MDIYDFVFVLKVISVLLVVMKLYGEDKFNFDVLLKEYVFYFFGFNKVDLIYCEMLVYYVRFRFWIFYW